MKFTAVLLIYVSVITIASAGKKHHKDDHGHVGYKFGYGVHDPHTHDIKSHHEERHGKHVTGYYTLKQPDGTTRVVHYKAGPHSGFEAIVEVIGHPHHDGHHNNHHNNHHNHHHNNHHNNHNHHHNNHHHNHHNHHENIKGHGNHKDHENDEDHNDHGHGYAVHEDEDHSNYEDEY